MGAGQRHAAVHDARVWRGLTLRTGPDGRFDFGAHLRVAFVRDGTRFALVVPATY